MPRSERSRRWLAAIRAAVVGALFWFAGSPALAHKASDSYLQITATPGRVEVRWDIALRDLDVALDLDSDGDGKLTWGEVRSAWPRIESYALQRLAIEGCPLTPVGRALERRNDGAYAVLQLSSPCTLPMPPHITYGLFADVDPTHRGIAKVQRNGGAVELSVLVPGAAAVAGGAAASGASTGASSPAANASPAGARSGAVARWEFFVEGV